MLGMLVITHIFFFGGAKLLMLGCQVRVDPNFTIVCCPSCWVAQATRLCRAATRRSEPGEHLNFFGVSGGRAAGVPSGQWPDGTGGSPVPPMPLRLDVFALKNEYK